jgi:methionine-S-sulfoxide reductase
MKLLLACLVAFSITHDAHVARTCRGPQCADLAHWGGFRSAIQSSDAIFAGGCFWCVEEAFEKVPGVISAVSGYTGGRIKNPTYEQVSSGGTGHVEAVRVTFDPAKVTYAQLLDAFWRNIDPTDRAGQFCDRGEQYRAAIFVRDDAQRAAAEQSKRAIEASGKLRQPIATTIETAGVFYVAEEYHQDYYKKNPIQYRFYKFSCGRERRLAAIWGAAK